MSGHDTNARVARAGSRVAMKAAKPSRREIGGGEITAAWIDEVKSIASSLKRIADVLDGGQVEVSGSFDPVGDILRKAQDVSLEIVASHPAGHDGRDIDPKSPYVWRGTPTEEQVPQGIGDELEPGRRRGDRDV